MGIGEERFARTTLVAAAELLGMHSQAAFNQMVVRLELEAEIPEDTSMSVAKKCGRLARIVARDAGREVETREGPMSLREAVVLEAVAVAEERSQWKEQTVLEQLLARDGYALRWVERKGDRGPWGGCSATLVAALPPELADEDTDDEVRGLLGARGFSTSRGHLEQAVGAHARGDWAAANGQIRTFIESLVVEVAIGLGDRERGNADD